MYVTVLDCEIMFQKLVDCERVQMIAVTCRISIYVLWHFFQGTSQQDLYRIEYLNYPRSPYLHIDEMEFSLKFSHKAQIPSS